VEHCENARGWGSRVRDASQVLSQFEPHRISCSFRGTYQDSESMRTMANSAADESMKIVREAENEHLYEPFQEVPPHVYDQIIEACRPFYALREPDEAPSLPDSTGQQTKHLQLPLRFEDSVAHRQHRPKATTAKRRIVSPSPEVRLCNTLPRFDLGSFVSHNRNQQRSSLSEQFLPDSEKLSMS
jgi:hypothetical protein